MSVTLITEIASVSQPAEGTLVVFMDSSGQIAKSAIEIAGESLIKHLIKAGGFKGERFKYVANYVSGKENFERLILLGIGNHKKFHSDDWLKLGGVCCSVIDDAACATIILELEGHMLSEDEISDFICGFRLRNYKFDKYKNKKREKKNNLKVILQTGNIYKAERAFECAQKLADSVIWTRDLVNEPANILGTEEFVTHIQELADIGVQVDLFNEKELEKYGFSALLSVARGSKRPARIAVMHWVGFHSNLQRIWEI